MGCVFTAIVDDISVATYNPALLSQLQFSNEIQSNYLILLDNDNYMSFGYFTGSKSEGVFVLFASRRFQNKVITNALNALDKDINNKMS